MVSLSIDPPPSQSPSPARPALRLALAAVAVAAVFGGGFWAGRATAPPAEQPASPPIAADAGAPAPAPAPAAGAAVAAGATPAADGAAAAAAPTAAAPVTGSPGHAATPPGVAPPSGAATLPAAPPAAAPIGPESGIRRTVVTLSGALEASIAAALGRADREHAEPLTAVVNRLLVWDLRVRFDARKGDRLEILWSPPQPAAPGLPPTGEPVVEALRYASSKLGTVIAAYRFQPEGARWPRYFRADGTELELRLVGGPIGDYEQVTSLLRDGRRHEGIDFKAPVGSPVLAPFDGVIARRNWNFAGNGNCLELRDPASGRRAIFLHLDVLPKEMAVGTKVREGQVIAASGNSGRSYAPHLHYQLEDAAGKVLDPFVVHRTERRALHAAERPAFEALRARLEAAFAGGAAPVAVPASSGR